MTREELKQYIATNLAGKMTPLDTGRYDPLYQVQPTNLLEVCLRLRDDENLKFDFFCNLAGVDAIENFEAVYSLASTTRRLRLDFKVLLPHDQPEIESVQAVWPGANWYEREIWELLGISVLNHENLTRFLLPDDWNQGHPLRKDWDAPDFVRMPEL